MDATSFSWSCATRSLVYVWFYVDVVCPFVLFLLAIVLSILRFTDSDYPFGIFKHFLKVFHFIKKNLQFTHCNRGKILFSPPSIIEW
jgi:hypothetical protein